MKFTGERMIPEENAKDLIYGEHMARYVYAAQFVRDKVVLDIACGSGYGTGLLAKAGAKHVIGADISEESIEYAKKTFNAKNSEFAVADAESMPFSDARFDIVVSFETIEHLPDYEAFLREVKRVLKKDGVFIISTPNKAVYPAGNPFHTKEFYSEEFVKALSDQFSHTILKYQDNFVQNNVYEPDVNNDIIRRSEGKVTEPMYLVAVCSDNNVVAGKDVEFSFFSKEMNSGNTQEIISDLQKWASNQSEIIDESNKLIAALQKEVDVKNTHIALTLKEIETSNAHVKRLSKEVDSKNELVKKLGEEVDSKNELVKKLGEEVDSKNELVKLLKSEIAESSMRMKELEKRLTNKDKLIAEISLEYFEKDEGEEGVDLLLHLASTLKERMERFEKSKSELETYKSYLVSKEKELQEVSEHLRIVSASASFKIGKAITLPLRILFPHHTRRRALAKIVLYCVFHPVKTLKKFSVKRTKSFLLFLKNTDGQFVAKKWNECMDADGTHVSQKTNAHECDSGNLKLLDTVDTTAKLVFQKHESPEVSIVIPVYNNWEYTYKCLLAILDNTDKVSYEIIIGDDCSNDETKFMDKFIKNIKVVRNENNLGFLKNCNNAAKVAKGKYVLFLNNDTQVQENWLAPLVELIERDDKIGMVGSKLVYPDGELQEAGGIVWKDASAWNYGKYKNPGCPEYNYVKEVDYISGASIMIEKDLWDTIGGFDERYVPAYYEDSDLAFEVRKHGYKLMYQPASVVVHFEGKSHGTDTSSGFKKYQIENREKFLQKWKKVLDKENFESGTNVFTARDRSGNKKTILVIDHYVPTYDQDAGSRTLYQYLKLFVKMGYNVKFLGDNFYRSEPYTSELEQLGVEVLYGAFYRDNWRNWISENGERIDFIYLHRACIAEKYIDFIRTNTDAKIVYNAVDFSFLRERRQYDVTGDKKYLLQATLSEEKENSIFNKSDTIITISEYEKKFLSEKISKKNVEVIPTYIYESFPESGGDFTSRKDIIFVGGFSHKPNVDGIIWFIEKIFPKIQSELSGIKLNIIGSRPPDELLKFASKNINVTGFVSDEELQGYYANSKIVIAPLRFGAGVKGKIIEAIANGVPVVTTEIGAEGIVDAKEILTVAKDESEFAAKVVELFNNEKLWFACHNKLSPYAKNHFGLQNAKKVIANIFK